MGRYLCKHDQRLRVTPNRSRGAWTHGPVYTLPQRLEFRERDPHPIGACPLLPSESVEFDRVPPGREESTSGTEDRFPLEQTHSFLREESTQEANKVHVAELANPRRVRHPSSVIVRHEVVDAPPMERRGRRTLDHHLRPVNAVRWAHRDRPMDGVRCSRGGLTLHEGGVGPVDRSLDRWWRRRAWSEHSTPMVISWRKF